MIWFCVMAVMGVTPSHHRVVDDLFSIETTMVVWGCPMTYHLVI